MFPGQGQRGGGGTRQSLHGFAQPALTAAQVFQLRYHLLKGIAIGGLLDIIKVITNRRRRQRLPALLFILAQYRADNTMGAGTDRKSAGRGRVEVWGGVVA